MNLKFLLRILPTPGNVISLLTFVEGYAYPTWLSFVAIESPELSDDRQWLTYWVVLSMINLIEKFAWPLLAWIPLYSLQRLLFITWLAHPTFKGATLVYDHAIRPLLLHAGEALRDQAWIQPYLQQIRAVPTPVETTPGGSFAGQPSGSGSSFAARGVSYTGGAKDE